MKLNSVLTLLFIALFTACKGGAYDLSGYGLKPDTGENASPLIAKGSSRDCGGSELRYGPDTVAEGTL